MMNMQLDIQNEILNDEMLKDIDEIDSKLNELDEIGLENILPLTEETKRLLNISAEHGIKASDVVTLVTFNHLIKCVIPSDIVEQTLKLISIRVPKKKAERGFRNNKFHDWVTNQITKTFYKTIRIGTFDLEVYHNYHFMANMVYHSMTHHDDEEEANKDYTEKLQNTELSESAIFILSLAFYDDKKASNIIKLAESLGLKNSISYHLNNHIVNALKMLSKVGKNLSIIEFYDDITEIAEKSISEQSEKIQKERHEYAKVIMDYEHEISQLKAKNNTLRIENSKLKGKPKLSDLKVLVIGDTQRREGYKKIIEKHGGEFAFIDGVEEATKSKKEAMKVDLIFHITTYGFHIVSNQIKEMENVVFVNNDGVHSLESEVLKLK